MKEAVAKRYAAALFEIALEQGRVEDLDRQAGLLEQLYEDSQIKLFFTSPRIPADLKKQVIDRQLADEFDPYMVNLMKLLVDKKRIILLPLIMRYFDVLTDRHRGVEEVSIVSAVPMTDEHLSSIVTELKRFSTYDELRVKTEVDSGVLGGVKVKLGENLVIDGTLSSQLRGMRERMYRYRHRGIGA